MRTSNLRMLSVACGLALACGGGSKVPDDLAAADPGTPDVNGEVASQDDVTPADPGTSETIQETTPEDNDPGTDAPDAEFQSVCLLACPDELATRCDGTGVQACLDVDDDGCLEWGPAKPCDAGATCVDGQCKLTCTAQECTVVGARRCKDAATTQSCGDGNGDRCLEWGDDKACDGGLVCSNGFCATTCSDTCTVAGAKKCDANAVVTCGDDNADGCLEWAQAAPCGELVCAGGRCQAQCSSDCTEDGARKCDGDGFATCTDTNADGCLEWGTVKPCGPTETCSNGLCSATCSDECTVRDATKCQMDAVSTCGDTNGDTCLEWGSPVPCDEGQTCSGGTCSTVCTSECTVKDAVRCDEAGRVVKCLDPKGDGCLKWGTPSDCTPPQVCDQGACGLSCSDECPGKSQKQCVVGTTDKFQTCDDTDADGCLEWGTGEACLASLVCSGSGDCVTACSDDCPAEDARDCDGNGWHACGDFNSDGCLEWGTTQYCTVAQECRSGACADLPPPATVLVSEILYDSAGSPDSDAFLELSGPPGLDLTGFAVVGVNGADGKDYATISLAGKAMPADGLFVIANPNAQKAYLDQADLMDIKVDFQNAPDSVQVRFGKQVVDALAYGTFTVSQFPAGEGTPAAKTSAPGRSLGRDEEQTDTDVNQADFREFAAPTPGAPNVVPNLLPTAQIQCPTGGKVGDELSFDASASRDPDGMIMAYEFDFGDLGTVGGNQATATHTYYDAGSYIVTLQVIDERGGKGQTTCNVAIESVAGNKPPTALVICPSGGKAGQALTFDGSGSSDADGSIASYAFTFGDGQSASGASATASHTYAAAGEYDVGLIVTDDKAATAEATCKVTVVPAGPPDRTISADTELCGAQAFGKLTIHGGAKVTCATGAIDITAVEVLVDPASSIDVSAVSGESSGGDYRFCGPTCVCDHAYTGGSGGGNATAGGSALSTMGDARSWEMGGCLGSCVQFGCAGATGGGTRGTSTSLDATLGGAGGAGCQSGYSSCYTPASGGKGGGSVRILATKSITVQGKILADGAGGLGAASPTAGAGGGAGGSIVLAAPSLSLSGQLSAAGGAGATGSKPGSYYNDNQANGGNGGQGWIKLCHGPSYSKTGTLTGAVVVESVMPPLAMQSSTHPDPALAYNDTFAQFDASWAAPFADGTGYWYALNRSASFDLTPANGTFTAGTTATFPDGTFSQAGSWYLRVIAVDGSAVAGTVAGRFSVNVNATPHTVASSSHANPNAWYAGTAVALSWTPPAGAAAASFPAFWYRLDRVSNTSPANAKASWTRTTNPQVVLTADSEGTPISGFAYYLHLVSEDTRGNLTKAAAHFRIQIGTEPAKMNFFGYVKDGGGAAINGAKVRMEPYGLETTTNGDGYFILNGTYEGTYAMTVTKDGFADSTATVQVNAGAVPYNVSLAP